MQDTLETPRLYLTRLTSVPPSGSPEFARLHELFSNEGARLWRYILTSSLSTHAPLTTTSLSGVSTSETETTTSLSNMLPSPTTPLNIVYAVHERLPDALPTTTTTSESTRFIGLVTIITRIPENPHLRLPPPFVPDLPPTALLLELAYMFLPTAWGRGLATEAAGEVVRAARGAGRGFWGGSERVWLRVIVNGRNGASGRVMEKVGLRKTGVYVWEGEKLWIGGQWAVRDDLLIFGEDLV